MTYTLLLEFQKREVNAGITAIITGIIRIMKKRIQKTH